MKPRHALMALGLAGTGALAFFGDKTPGGDVAEPVPRRAVAQAAMRGVATAVPTAAGAGTTIVALRPRADLLGEEGEGALGANTALFRSQDWTPAPAPSPVTQVAAQAPPPPPAPPLPLTYIGKAVGDGVWEVFLAGANKTYLVRESTVIDGQYRVDRIAPPTITLTYLPLGQVQQINIGALD